MTTPSFLLYWKPVQIFRHANRPGARALSSDRVAFVDPTARLGVQLAGILEAKLFLDPCSVSLYGSDTYT